MPQHHRPIVARGFEDTAVHFGCLLDELLQGRRDRLAGWVGQLDDHNLAELARGLQALVAVASAASRARSA
ncbi:MAG: hypothetical protein HY690_11490 [Chloroflexi bacterium]|nr:hypothetical protein [Chloroflexota bacterium]